MNLRIRLYRLCKYETLWCLVYITICKICRYILKHILIAFLVKILCAFENIHVDTVAPNATRFHAVPSSTARHLLPLSPSVQNTTLPAVPADGNALTA